MQDPRQLYNGRWEKTGGKREAGSGIPKVAGTGRNFFATLQYLAIEKAQRGANYNGRGGNRENKARGSGESGKFRPLILLLWHWTKFYGASLAFSVELKE